MRLLIDTQVFVWLVNEDVRLGQGTLKTLQDTSNEVFISYFSFFEMTIKASIGKLGFDNTIVDDLPKMGIELILPNKTELKNYAIFNPDNKDPCDNILAAVAVSEKCIFVTGNPKILAISSPALGLLNATK